MSSGSFLGCFVESNQEVTVSLRLGSPAGHDNDLLKCNVDDITVCRRPLTAEFVKQELAGHEPGRFMSRTTTYTKSSDYINALLMISDNQISKADALGLDSRSVWFELYARAQFGRIRTAIHDSEEPMFCLVHGDSMMHPSNFLFDGYFNLVGMIDWGKSRVVPRQFLCAPAWLFATFDAMVQNMDKFNTLTKPFAELHAPHFTPKSTTSLWLDGKQEANYALDAAVTMALVEPCLMYDLYWTTMASPAAWKSTYDSYTAFFYNVLEPAVLRFMQQYADEDTVTDMAMRQVNYWITEDPQKKRAFKDPELDIFLVQAQNISSKALS
ncbi:hypothetical protein VHEMI10724 [[Torrubiella] hemipterigena]|uniref:Aminoglycoside phosphotransferase domain-containing protein n=1 Tax=[Torrubiella] hemipterigena TaxID=1531966 RepID=A0A0A1TSE0_9HYPO|nr:hypothetical protein VHEMI10724 [[Torrubiella] hemipterigena]